MKHYAEKNQLQLDVDRFQDEFEALSQNDANELAFRCVMRLLPSGIAELSSRDGFAILRQLLTASLVMVGKVDVGTLRAAAEMRVIPPTWGAPKEAVQSKYQTQQVVRALTNSDRSAAFGAANYFLFRTGLGGMREGSVTQLDMQQIRTKDAGPWQGMTDRALPAALPKTFSRGLADLPLEKRQSVHPFWNEWYQHITAGKPQNWDLLRDLALIDNALWEEGGEALDRAISLTVERHRLFDEVRRLLGSLRAAEQSSQAIIGPGHNHPPGPLDPEPDLIAACDVIQQGLETAEQALSQPAPPPTTIRRIAITLGDAALAILRYCARLSDAAAMEAAKSIGKWGGAAGIAWYAAHAESIQNLAKDLFQWAASAF